MPVAPLVEQHDAELTSFYVRPPMMAYKKPNAFGQVKQSTEQEKTKISSYRELLFSDNGTYKRIYVTADAGMGKTSFSKMLARTWCQAHKPNKDVADKFSKDDLDTMRNFDFLFLIKLREYQGADMCCLDDMIVTMLQSKLPKKSIYTEIFFSQILCNRQCLIIADGLDEWSHPEHTRSLALPVEVIPHTTRMPGCCSVLTTTRPWKLSAARLSMADIDRQVEITELDKATARELESNAVEIMNKNQRQNDQVAANSKTKTVTDFENSVPEKILGHILYIPFVLLQMICLWFGNNPVGKSFCEVYSNIIELTLTRWLVKTDSGHTDCECEPSTEHENIKLKCMENNRHCQRYMPLLLKIGQLAFSTLFNVIREESLLFGKEQVLKYLSKEELKQCLAMGLLSQVKDMTSLSEVRLQLYFPHKTLHEYFCALFIATNWINADTGIMAIKQTISKKCTSVSDILEMSEVFVFVCGLNPEVYSDISRHLATIVSRDQSVIDYRNRVEEEDSGLLVDYQDMQISCFLESTRNQHPECKIVIEDMIVDSRSYGYMEEDEKQALERILPYSACRMKSLTLDDLPSAGGIVRILEHAEFPCLKCLSVEECKLTLFQSVLTSAAPTLKYLKLYKVSLTDDLPSAGEIVRILEHAEFPCLERLSVEECKLTLFQSVLTSAAHALKYLKLYKVSLTDDLPSAGEIVRILENAEFPCLEHLSVQGCELTLFPSVLTSATHTLKYLKLELVSLTYDMWSAISTLNNLHGLYLGSVDGSSDILNAVSDCISGCMSLQKLRLDFLYWPSGTDEKPEQPEASINCLLRSIEVKTMLTYLRLGVDVGHQNYVLDLSKHDKLQELYLYFSLTELHINSEQLVTCEVRRMDGFSAAAAVSSLLAELHGAPLLKTLRLEHVRNPPPRIDITALPLLTEFTLIRCVLRDSTVTLTLPLLTEFTLVDCDLRDSTVTLTLPLLTEFTLVDCDLRDSTVTLTLPLMTEFTLSKCDLRDSTVTLTLPLLTEFTLSKCDLRDSTVTLTLPQLTKFTLWCCDLRDSTVTLSPEMTSLETFKLDETTVNIPGCREMFLSISKLPQPITVKMREINMTAGEWRELLFDILGKLPKSIHVEMRWCKGPSEEEWRNIFDDMKASPAFCVTSTKYKVSNFSWKTGAFITFDTVVV